MEKVNVNCLLMLMFLTTPRLIPSAVDILIPLNSFYLSVVLGQNMKVISTDAGASVPREEGRAEILNSSLVKYSSLTVCARFLTLHFTADPDGWPIQSLISYEKLREGFIIFTSEKVWIRPEIFTPPLFGYF